MKKAFTLTEIIITLAMVGVIAALTLPSVMKGYREKVYSAQLKKTVSMIENAAKAVMSDEHTSSFFETTAGTKAPESGCEQGVCYFLTNYFKYSRANCDKEDIENSCAANVYKASNGTEIPTLFNHEYCILTINGATICMWNSDIKEEAALGIDINGPDAPNVTGVDAFVLFINPDGSVRSWGEEDRCNKKAPEQDYGHIADYAQGCFQKVINNNWKIKEE